MADTAAYGKAMRRLLETDKKDYDQNTYTFDKLGRKTSWELKQEMESVNRRKQGWNVSCNENYKLLEFYEFDTLRCFYQIPCVTPEGDWQRTTVNNKTWYGNGKLRTEGEFLILTSFKRVYSFPISRHFLYRTDQSIRSIATFDKYGLAICDSIFDRSGNLKKIKSINMAEVLKPDGYK